MTNTDQNARWVSASRKPFHFFQTVEDELSAGIQFWRNRAPLERLEYLEFMRRVIFGEAAVNAKMIRCYGRRKLNEDTDPKDIVYF